MNLKICDDAKKYKIPHWIGLTPFLTVDGIVKVNSLNKIALIKRKNPPFGLALPGGFVDYNEKVEDALFREMKEELNVEVKIIKIFGVYSDPKRDPRFHTASVVFECETNQIPKAGDDAKEVVLLDLSSINLEELVFDHGKILADYLNSNSVSRMNF